MTKTLQLELPDAIYDALDRLAQRGGQSAEQMVTEWISAAARTIAGKPTPALRSRGRQPAGPTNTADNTKKAGAAATSRQVQTLADTRYELQITLRESKPAIWRRLQVPGGITLLKLHRAL